MGYWNPYPLPVASGPGNLTTNKQANSRRLDLRFVHDLFGIVLLYFYGKTLQNIRICNYLAFVILPFAICDVYFKIITMTFLWHYLDLVPLHTFYPSLLHEKSICCNVFIQLFWIYINTIWGAGVHCSCLLPFAFCTLAFLGQFLLQEIHRYFPVRESIGTVFRYLVSAGPSVPGHWTVDT